MPNPEGRNGSKPSPPEAIIRPLVEDLVARGFKNEEIVKEARAHYDTDKYALRLTGHINSIDVLKKKRSMWKIYSSRGQRHTVDSIAPAVERVHKRFPNIGYRKMKDTLLREEQVAVSRPKVLEYLKTHYPDEVQARKGKHYQRKQFWTAGVNDVWCMDQHDKWRKYQLFLHLGMEAYSGMLLWVKIWWTNRNPKLICGYYCDTVERLNAMPLLTQSDPGTENNGIANAHTILRHRHDPSLSESLQHKFKGNKGNIKPEIGWRMLRSIWTPGFEKTLDYGITHGLYDPDDVLERLVFHYIFIPWLQKELDAYVALNNDSMPRFNRHKVLPHGRPIAIFTRPEDYDTHDFSVKVEPEHLNFVRNTYAPPDHPVFQLVPEAFAAEAVAFYGDAGPPVVDTDNVWQIYSELLAHFRTLQGEHLQTIVATRSALPAVGEDGGEDGEEFMPVLNLRHYREGDAVVGGPAGPSMVAEVICDIEEPEPSAAGASSDESDGYNYWTDEPDNSE